MTLDAVDRGLLDKEIDGQIQRINTAINSARNQFGKMTKITNETDFAFGYVLGATTRGFIDHYFERHKSAPTEDDMNEISRVITNRIPEIKDAIFNAG